MYSAEPLPGAQCLGTTELSEFPRADPLTPASPPASGASGGEGEKRGELSEPFKFRPSPRPPRSGGEGETSPSLGASGSTSPSGRSRGGSRRGWFRLRYR